MSGRRDLALRRRARAAVDHAELIGWAFVSIGPNDREQVREAVLREGRRRGLTLATNSVIRPGYVMLRDLNAQVKGVVGTV